MEESFPLDRIPSEGRGMSASTQEYDMNTKQLFAGAAVATALAWASSAYAGQLGGIGSLGGNLGGNLGGMGGASRLGGAGAFDSRGDLNGSMNKKPISKTVNQVDGASAASVANDAAANSASAAPSKPTRAAPAKSANAAPAPAAEKPTTSAPAPAKPSTSTSLAGGADQTATAASHSASGGANGSLGAEHSSGSTSAAAAGAANGSANGSVNGSVN
jgi:hypothetical protein